MTPWRLALQLNLAEQGVYQTNRRVPSKLVPRLILEMVNLDSIRKLGCLIDALTHILETFPKKREAGSFSTFQTRKLTLQNNKPVF